ncbi:helicase [Lithohypha guttulata]|nr:helicase [Lithohypha guttulata]
MNFKPFKPPGLKRLNERNSSSTSQGAGNQFKRRKLSPDDDEEPTNSVKFERPPLKPVSNSPNATKIANSESESRTFFSIVWRKITPKKNKTWEDDGILVYKNGAITAYNSKGHRLGGCVREKEPELEDLLSLSGKDIQIEAKVSYEDFARIVGRDNSAPKDENVVIHHGKPQQNGSTQKSSKAPKKSLQDQMRQQIKESSAQKAGLSSKTALLPSARNAAFRQPMKDAVVTPQQPSEVPVPRHDPTTPNAVVFKRPQTALPGKQIVDVVLDPLLTARLRHHQREGVQFLYECVMGLRDFGGQGCILADDMGLGKTLQTIALIWTLVKQNPVYKDEPPVKKVLIVCPVTLVQNWKKEFRKWLGRDRLGVMSFGDEGSRLSMFDGRNFKVMIVGYERLQKIAEDLTRGSGIDLVICDEGHRLKSLQNKSAKAIETLNTTRRVILSGTPIQNDLGEFFAMVNFVNDGVLGSWKGFVKDYEKPIMKSRQPKATEEDIERGQEASDDLAKTVLKTAMCQDAQGSKQAALQMITILKKLCNSPALLRPKSGADEDTTPTSLETLEQMMPRGTSRFYHNSYASKIRLLDELLHQIQQTTNDKVVLVSNYTATLDIMQNLLTSLNLSFRRLDGSVPAGKRQAMVDEFNRSSPTACFAFLLSAKAGGVGINLVGGSRLVLFDVDWNPATDDQAMARIHREGQKKACYIYRFVIKGGLEERIWQRQVVKRGLADSIMDNGANSGGKQGSDTAAFSMDELKDLFRLDERDGLRTHDLISCDCGGKGYISANNGSVSSEKDSMEAYDIDHLESDGDEEQPLSTFSFVKASEISEQVIEDQEESIRAGSSPRKPSKKKQRKQQNAKLEQELMTYTHIDTSIASSLDETELQALGDVVDDPCLMHVLKQGRNLTSGDIAYIFMKQSKVTVLGDHPVDEAG